MTEFLNLIPPGEALDLLLKQLNPRPEPEQVDTQDALGRVTFAPIIAPYPLPSFPRSTVDGYAVRALDTYGASESLPAYLTVVGEVKMGSAAFISLETAQCALIHTGGMLPAEANAVVMVEHTQVARAGENTSSFVSHGEVEINRAVAVGENVIDVGEDVAAGEEVIPSGFRLRPAEIGGLMALGITQVRTARRPRVGILSTGDEIVAPGEALLPGQVRDVNSYTLAALVAQCGGVPTSYGILPDRLEAIQAASRTALKECDVVVITAGSSASVRDLTSQVVNNLGKPGVLVHGVNIRPGKPTILAVCAPPKGNLPGKAVIGLPGNPVSALVIASLFLVPVIEAQLGLRKERARPSVSACLTLNLASQAGREDWVPVRLISGTEGYQAEPIFGKSNLIFTLARADGMIRIPPDATGLRVGEEVEVIPL